MTDIPQWAAQKACDLANRERLTVDCYAYDVGEIVQSPILRALARLIAKTMPEPVDPLVEALKALECYTPDQTAAAIRAELSKRGLEVAPVKDAGHD